VGIDIFEVINPLPSPDSETSSNRCAERCRLAHGRSVDRDADEVRLNLESTLATIRVAVSVFKTHLHGQVGVGHATVDGQFGQGLAAVLSHGI
jgi:hypothetical protein